MTTDDHPRAAQEREAVERLAGLILAKLAQRRHHGDWRTDGQGTLMRRIADEYAEAQAAWLDHEDEHVIAELVDVAASCALYIDREAQR